MSPQSLKVGTNFHVLGLIQTQSAWESVAASLKQFVKESRATHPEVIKEILGPLVVLGRQDLLVRITTGSPETAAQHFYDCMDALSSNPSLVGGFGYVLGFEWKDSTSNLTEHVPQLPCGALLLVKYNTKVAYLGRAMFTDSIVAAVEQAKKESPRLVCDYWGGLSWHECCILVLSDRYQSVWHLVDLIRRDSERVLSVTPFPVFTPMTRQESFQQPGHASPPTDPEQLQVLTRAESRVPSNLTPQVLKNLASRCAGELTWYRSIAKRPITIGYSPKRIDDVEGFLRAANECRDLGKLSTEILLPFPAEGPEPVANACPVPPPAPSAAVDTPGRKPPDAASWNVGRGIAVPLLKLRALRTQLSHVIRSEDLASMLPTGLDEALTRIEKAYGDGELSETALLYYISEIKTALRERLAGSELSPSESLPSTRMHDVAGSQRILIACERLLIMCYEFNQALGRNLGVDDDDKPIAVNVPTILTFFDYNDGAPPRPPRDVLQHAVGDDLPIVIRLPMMRYRPWLWPVGIAALGMCVQPPPVLHGQIDLDMATHPVQSTTAAAFVGQFVKARNYVWALAEQLNVVSRTKHGGVSVCLDRLRYLQERSHTFTFDIDRLYRSDPGLADLERAYAQRLSTGEICSDVGSSRKKLAAFVNAYASLGHDVRSGAAAFGAFVISLNKSPFPSEVGRGGTRR